MTDISLDTHPLFNAALLDFYQEIARNVGISEEDMSTIFTLAYGEPTKLEQQPSSILFELQDQYPVSFTCTMGGNALLLFAESQRNKTTSLVAIATLLGYQWDDPSNIHFLNDEEFAKKGRARREHFMQGQNAHLKIVKGRYHLSIEAADGEVSIIYETPYRTDKQTFEVQRSWTAFEHYMSHLVDVQLVSKGRSFIERVESDVLHDFWEFSQILMRNAEAEHGKLTSRMMRRPRQEEERQIDKIPLAQEIEKIQQKLQDNERQKKQYLTRLVSIKYIADRRGQLDDHELQAIEKLYRLERELRTAEETKQEQIAYRDNLLQKEERIKQLQEACQGLIKQKKAIDETLAALQNNIVTMFDEHRLIESKEVERLFSCIEVADIQSICASANNKITSESLQFYTTLIQTLENFVSPGVVILPLNENIQSAGALLTQLREDLDRVKNIVGLNEAIDKFVQRIQVQRINRTMTPLMYRDLVNNLSRHNKELNLLEAEFKADQEAEVSTIGEKDTEVVRSQIEEARKALTLHAQEIKDEIGERLESLEGLSDVPLEKIWSPAATSYLKELERKADEALRRLRMEQHELEREKEQKSSPLVSTNDQSLVLDQLSKRATSIRRFNDVVSYVSEFCEGHERRSYEFSQALQSLENQGFAKRLKETIDQLITDRCKYYYDNSSGRGEPIPLTAILYEQRNGRALFRFNQMELERTSLSGGTESVMTVRSLASKISIKPFGTVLLVDEWGDVEQIGEPLYREIGKMESILAAIFIKVEDIAELKVRPLN